MLSGDSWKEDLLSGVSQLSQRRRHRNIRRLSDLAGWSLTDDIKNLAGWKLPAVKVEAGGFLLVFASGKNRAAAGEELDADF